MTTPHDARPVVEVIDADWGAAFNLLGPMPAVGTKFYTATDYDALRSEVERLREERSELLAEAEGRRLANNDLRTRAEAAEATLEDFIEAAEHYFNTGTADALRAVLNEKINARGDEGNG